MSVKIEMNEEISVGFDSIDELPSKIEQPSSDVVKTERQDLPLHKYGGRYVEFMEPVKVRVSCFDLRDVLTKNLVRNIVLRTTAFTSCGSTIYPSLDRPDKFARISSDDKTENVEA